MVSYFKVNLEINFAFDFSNINLARLPTETARVFFLSHFLKKDTFFLFFLLLVPV